MQLKKLLAAAAIGAAFIGGSLATTPALAQHYHGGYGGYHGGYAGYHGGYYGGWHGGWGGPRVGFYFGPGYTPAIIGAIPAITPVSTPGAMRPLLTTATPLPRHRNTSNRIRLQQLLIPGTGVTAQTAPTTRT